MMGSSIIVLSFGVMHHINNWEKAFEEIVRVLKHDGYFIFGDITYSNLSTRILKPLVKNYGVYTIDGIIQYLKSNNFEMVHRETPKGFFLRYHSIVIRRIQRIDEGVEGRIADTSHF